MSTSRAEKVATHDDEKTKRHQKGGEERGRTHARSRRWEDRLNLLREGGRWGVGVGVRKR